MIIQVSFSNADAKINQISLPANFGYKNVVAQKVFVEKKPLS
jgi:hypothetical protein